MIIIKDKGKNSKIYVSRYDSLNQSNINNGGSIDESYITEGELDNTLEDYLKKNGVKTINGESIVGEGNIIIEGSEVDLSDYYTKDEVDEKIENIVIPEVPTPDWNAQEGEPGYIENRTHYHCNTVKFKYNEYDNLYETDYISHTDGKVYIEDVSDWNRKYEIPSIETSEDGQSGYDWSNALTISFWDDYEEYYGKFMVGYDMDNSKVVAIYNTNEADVDYVSRIERMNVFNVVQIESEFIPDTVLKTTPQTLSNAAKNQVKENLGISTPNWNAQGGEAGYIENRTHYYDSSRLFSFDLSNADITYDNGNISKVIFHNIAYSDSGFFIVNTAHLTNGYSLNDSMFLQKKDVNSVHNGYFSSYLKENDNQLFDLVCIDFLENDSIDGVFSDIKYTDAKEKFITTLDEKYIPDTIARKSDVYEESDNLWDETTALWENVESIEQSLDGKQDEINDLDTIRSGAAKGATALQSYTEQYKGTVTGVKINGTTKNPSNGVVDLGTVITSHQDISGKQDKLVSGSNIKTINGQSILGSGNVTIEGGSGGGNANIVDLTQEEYDAITPDEDTLYVITDAPSVDLSTKQDTLVSGSNIKTINGVSILGSGNITIEAGTSNVEHPRYYLYKSTDSSFPSVALNANKTVRAKILANWTSEELPMIIVKDYYNDTICNNVYAKNNYVEIQCANSRVGGETSDLIDERYELTAGGWLREIKTETIASRNWVNEQIGDIETILDNIIGE